MANFFRKVGLAIKSLDLYGQRVQLTYKGNATFMTCCGGLVSLIFMLAMMATFSYQIYDLAQEAEFKSYAPTYEYDQRFNVTKGQSMVAIKIIGRDPDTKLNLTNY